MVKENFLQKAVRKNNKLVATGLYHLYITAAMSVSFIFTLVVNVLIGVFVMMAVGDRSGSTDIILLIFALILGIIFFSSGYKFAVVNGTSRRTYFFALLAAVALTSLVWTLMVLPAIAIGERVGTILSLVTLLYGGIRFGSFLWLFVSTLALAMLGVMARLIFYRSSKRVKLIIFMGLILFCAALMCINILSNGTMLAGLGRFFIAVLGLKTQNPYIGCLFMLALAALFSLFSYLLIRRAPVK